jgi:hypothetical protein
VGPYELHDFFLYYVVRWGFTPGKILRLAVYAFSGLYDRETILRWLRIFISRFFAQQFKRSCLPDGPKVGSVTLSPRGDWRMPSDASAALMAGGTGPTVICVEMEMIRDARETRLPASRQLTPQGKKLPLKIRSFSCYACWRGESTPLALLNPRRRLT